MELVNKRIYYSFTHECEAGVIDGNVEIADNKIISLNGNLRSEEGSMGGYINFSENSDGTVNKSFSNLPEGVDLCETLTEMVTAVKETIA